MSEERKIPKRFRNRFFFSRAKQAPMIPRIMPRYPMLGMAKTRDKIPKTFAGVSLTSTGAL